MNFKHWKFSKLSLDEIHQSWHEAPDINLMWNDICTGALFNNIRNHGLWQALKSCPPASEIKLGWSLIGSGLYDDVHLAPLVMGEVHWSLSNQNLNVHILNRMAVVLSVGNLNSQPLHWVRPVHDLWSISTTKTLHMGPHYVSQVQRGTWVIDRIITELSAVN
jgi:hypothetical protein